MALVREVITFATHRDELKAWIGLPLGEDLTIDVKLTAFLNVATSHADTYLDRPFKEDDEDGEETGDDIDWENLPEHAGIKTGVFEFARHLWEVVRTRPFGLTSARTRDLSKSFAIGSRIAGGEVTPLAISKVVRHYWRPSKRAIW